MKKILIVLILTLSFLSTYADIAIPQNPCKEGQNPYHDFCYEDNENESKNFNFFKENLIFELVLLFVIFPTLFLLYKIRKNNK